MSKPYVTVTAEQIVRLQQIAGLHAASEIDLYAGEHSTVDFVAWHTDEDDAIASGSVSAAGRVSQGEQAA